MTTDHEALSTNFFVLTLKIELGFVGTLLESQPKSKAKNELCGACLRSHVSLKTVLPESGHDYP